MFFPPPARACRAWSSASSATCPRATASAWALPPRCWARRKIVVLDEPTRRPGPGADDRDPLPHPRPGQDPHGRSCPAIFLSEVQSVCDRVLIIAHGRLVAQGTPEELAAQLAAKGTITATAQGSREAVVAAAGAVPGLTDVRVTDEKGGEVSFTAVSTAGSDLRGALSAGAGPGGLPGAEPERRDDEPGGCIPATDRSARKAGRPETTPAPETQTEEKEANGDEVLESCVPVTRLTFTMRFFFFFFFFVQLLD